jgi:hypothetical protein
VVAASVVAAVYVFALPQVEIAFSHDVLIESNPSSETFIIENKSFYPLWEVEPFVGLCYLNIQLGGQKTPRDKTLRSLPAPACEGSLYGKRIGAVQWTKRTLGIGGKYTIALVDAIAIYMPVVGQEISIIADYRPWFVPCTLRKEVKFTTRQLPDGNLHWFESEDYHRIVRCF